MPLETLLKKRSYYSLARAEILEYIPSDAKKILEFGCGEGELLSEIKRRNGAECWAVEMHKESAKIAQKCLDRVISGNAEDCLELVPNEYFECILLCDVLEHFHDPFKFLLEVKKKINSKGVIIASIPNVRHYQTFKEYVINGDWEYKSAGILDYTHLHFFTYKSIVSMFEKLDYEIVSLEGINASRRRWHRILNFLSFNKFYDLRFLQYAVVAKPR